MAIKDSPLEVQELGSETEGSDPGSDWDDSDYDMLQETHSKFSNLSIRNKAKERVVEGTETDPEVTEASLDEEDEENLEKVHKIIKAGLVEKLKVDDCKLYLRKNDLRLTGNKDTLIQRIKEHLEIINGGGEKKYPPSSFVLNCKGDACTGDVVLFEQNVYEMFNIASRSASGPPCGKRIVAGRIVKESYGAAKQQHTFTIEVLWSKGEKPLPPLHPLLIKGRNLYRLKTLRQKWEDEGKRQKILMEKHSRGSVARADREARIHEKEKRKAIMKNRVSKKDPVRNHCQSHSGLSANTRKASSQIQSSSAIVKKAATATQQCGKSIDSKGVAHSGKTSFPVHHRHSHQAFKRSADCRGTFDIDHFRRDELSADYPDIYSREKGTAIEKHSCPTETNGFTVRTHHRKPLANANHFLPVMTERENHANHFPPGMTNREGYKQKQPCRAYARGRCYFGDNCKFLHDLRERHHSSVKDYMN